MRGLPANRGPLGAPAHLHDGGHVGCCDSSRNRHASAHYNAVGHPVVHSFEPGENWWWCYADQTTLEVEGAEPAPSYERA